MQRGPTVALDARLVGYAAGIAQYTIQLARALAALDGPERYVLLQGRRAPRAIANGPNVRLTRALTPPHHRLERWTLPLEVLPARPDLLHSTDHVAPRWRRWRSVVTLHDLAFLRFPETHTAASRAYYAAAAESARQAERVIAVSRSTADDAIAWLGVNPTRLRVVHEAAGPEFVPRSSSALAALAQRLGFDAGRRYVLAVGTLEPRKNHVLLLEAFARLPADLGVQLLLASGRGWLDAPIFEAHARLGLGERVRFLGWLGNADLAILYSHAAVLAFPSLYEGFGLPPLEAMACGAPVVSSHAGPMPEVLEDAALLLPPEDPTVWAAALRRVLADAALADDLRNRGRARAAAFSWERAARETRAVYREALGLGA